ncbi:penicillin-binding protein [Gracilibacillus dipsosauri]|uniref:Penicillin-binding protein n=2 Tax=Gracilibacillus dipsosauri TaxID=178340 RepID=A0A317KWE6_9BACI|nr:penicillin-binding protein [Gracilibacillus dipsosauri]
MQNSWVMIKRFKVLVIIFTAMIFFAFCGYLFLLFGGSLVFNEAATYLPQTSKVVTEDGTILGKLYSENREYVSIDEIPEHVEAAFLSLEDKDFYEHSGISFPAVARALYRDILAMSKVEGGSTITQQLAKNLFLVNDKTWMRKTKEVMASIYLERNYSKEKILELYLNEVYFAHGIYGVGTAADYFFGKDISELTIDEGALLAAMVKAPNTYSPYIDKEKAKERRDLALSQMEKYGEISTEEMLSFQAKTINVQTHEQEEEPWLDDYFDHVLKEVEYVYGLSREALKRGGYTIEVYMDPLMQKIAYQKMLDDSFFQASNQKVDGTFVLMEQESGHLKALIAGRDFSFSEINQLHVAKQPGSIMKPLAVYGPAMQLGEYKPYDLLLDKDIDYDGYHVKNADGQYDGQVTMYEAINQSKNAPAVWLLDQIGIDYSKAVLEKMNLTIKDKGLAIALGGLEKGLTPIEITEAYRTFIHRGQWTESRSIQSITDSSGEIITPQEQKTTEIFNQQVAWNMVRMLEGVVQTGTAQNGDFSKALAGKTGSTEHPHSPGNIKDAWFAGFTPDYVMSAWIGFSEAPAENYLTTGSEAPTRLTKSILQEIDKHHSLKQNFEKPNQVKELPKPIGELPVITDLSTSIEFGGFTVIQGELNWTVADDERIVYQIYEQREEKDKLVGEVKGKGNYTVGLGDVFQSKQYYVVPYNPLTEQSGQPSNITTFRE